MAQSDWQKRIATRRWVREFPILLHADRGVAWKIFSKLNSFEHVLDSESSEHSRSIPSTAQYFEEHKILVKIEDAIRRLAAERPDDPIKFLRDVFSEVNMNFPSRTRTFSVETFPSCELTTPSDDTRTENPVSLGQNTEQTDQVFSLYLTDLANSVRRATT